MTACCNVPTQCKASAEEIIFTMDFSNWLKAAGNATIASIDSITDTPSGDLTISGQVVSTDSKKVQFRVADGTDGEDYELAVLVTLSDTQKFQGKGTLQIRD